MMSTPVFKRTLISSAVAMACYGSTAQAACPGPANVSTAEAACNLPGAGSVTVTSTGSLPTLDVAAPGTGTVDNAGTIGQTNTSSNTPAINYNTDLTGTLNNSGLIRNGVTGLASTTPIAVQIQNDLSGTLTNTGTIEASIQQVATSWSTKQGAEGVSIGNDLSGTLTNQGTISASINEGPGTKGRNHAYGVYVENSIAAGGTLDNSGLIEGKVNNLSAWASTIAGVYIEGDMDGTIKNSGTIQGIVPLDANGPSGGTAYGIYISGDVGATGSIDNSGTIKAFVEGSTSGGTAYGLYIEGAVDGSLDNSGLVMAEVISNDTKNNTGGGGAAGIYIGGNINGTLDNSGTVKAIMEGSTWGKAYGVYVSDQLDGTLTNTGYVAAHYDVGGASTSGANGTVYGIYINRDVTGTFDNQGTIKASGQAQGTSWGASFYAYGVELDADLDGTFKNSGTITADVKATTLATAGDAGFSAYGVHLSLNNNGSFENSGTIIASGVANGPNATEWVGGSAYGVELDNDHNGSFTNSGTIRGYAEANGGAHTDLEAMAFGVRVDGNFNAGATLVNTGLIEAQAKLSGGAGTGSETLEAYGIFLEDDFSGTIDNSGTIAAMITGAANPTRTAQFAIFVGGDGSLGTLTNSGTIIGDVQLNGGTLNLNGGVIDGAITSFNALDINVGGEHKSSEIDIAGANVDDFAIVNGGNWILDAPIQDVTSFTVNGTGRLTFANSNVGLTEDITGTGTVAVNSGVNATLTGNYTQGAGGTFEVQTNSPDSIGRLTVTGTADLSASNQVSVDVQGLLEVDAPIEDILTAGTLTAGPLTTSDNSLFYVLTASVDGNTIDLSVDRDLFVVDAVEAADLPYANGIATALDQLLTNGGTGQGIDGIVVALGNLPGAEEVAEAVAQMVPTGAGEATTAAQQSANQFSNIVGNRITGQRGLSAGDSGMYEQGHMWVKPFGGFSEQDRRGGVPGFESNTVGIGFGGDISNGRLLLGAGFAWSDTEVDSKTISRNELDVESYQLVFYGNYDLDETSFVEGYAMVGWNENDSLRDINFGTFSATAKADFDSIFTRVYTGVGRDYKQSDRFTLTPVATLRYTYIDQDGYTEDGAGALNLIVGDNDQDSLILGLDAVGTYQLDADGTYAMSARAGVGYDVLNDRTLITSTFAGGGGAFATNGAKADEFVYRAGFGLKATPKDLMSVRLDYEFEGRADYQAHGGSINFRWQF